MSRSVSSMAARYFRPMCVRLESSPSENPCWRRNLAMVCPGERIRSVREGGAGRGGGDASDEEGGLLNLLPWLSRIIKLVKVINYTF